MKNIRLILLTLFIAVLSALPAAAAGAFSDYYVDINNGNDLNDGLSPGTGAWQTLHHAADMTAESGFNTIHVAAGVYSVANGEFENTLQFYMSNSSILGDPAGGTVIDATSPMYYWTNGLELYLCDNVTVSNITVRNAHEEGIYINQGSGNTITGCALYNNGMGGSTGIYADNCTNTTITGCDIYNNFGDGIYLFACDSSNTVTRNRIYDNYVGIRVYAPEESPPGSPFIVNNLIYGPMGNMGRGIMVESYATLYTTTAAPTIYHNTIDSGILTGIHLYAGGSSFSSVVPDIQYNIITNCGQGIYGSTDGYGGTVNPGLDYNDLFGNTTDYDGTVSSGGANSKYEDPLYAGANDFHLSDASPCIDAATTSTVNQDLEGAFRPQGLAADMGCYESSSEIITPSLPGITVLPYQGLTTTESGTSATFTVKLDTLPSSNVNIPLSSSDTGEGTVSPASLTFTAYNWFTPQTVVVKGVNDNLIDGDIAYTVSVGPAVSNTFDYNGLSGPDVAVVNLDDDSADIIVDPTSGLKTSRFGGSDTFTVVLNSQPVAPVTVSLSSSDPASGTVSPQELTFTPNNWNVPQTVTVTGQDNMMEENVTYTIITAPAVSNDPDYNGLDPDDVDVTNVYNLPPAQPDYVYPRPFQMFAPGSAITLQGSNYYDPEGDKHVESWWRIAPLNRGAFGCNEYPTFFEHVSKTDLTTYAISTQDLMPGVIYVWIVGYKDAGSGVFTWSDKDEQEKNTFMIGVKETADLPPAPPGATAANFVMRSCHHYIPDNSSASIVIGDDLSGGYDPRYYRIGTYDPLLNDGGYHEYPAFSLFPGTAFWVLARNGLTISVTGIAMSTTEDVDIQLPFNNNNQNGWSMIGPPNDRNYPWNDVQVVLFSEANPCEPAFGPVRIGDLDPDNPYIDTRLLEWTGSSYSESSMMMSGYGYWVKARQEKIVLRFPVSAQASFRNPNIMLAVGMDKIKKTALQMISPSAALAENDNDMPPAPMATIDSDGVNASFGSSSGGNCFIESLNYK